MYFLKEPSPGVGEFLLDSQEQMSLAVFERLAAFPFHGSERVAAVGLEKVMGRMFPGLVPVEDASFYALPPYEQEGIGLCRGQSIEVYYSPNGDVSDGGSYILEMFQDIDLSNNSIYCFSLVRPRATFEQTVRDDVAAELSRRNQSLAGEWRHVQGFVPLAGFVAQHSLARGISRVDRLKEIDLLYRQADAILASNKQEAAWLAQSSEKAFTFPRSQRFRSLYKEGVDRILSSNGLPMH